MAPRRPPPLAASLFAGRGPLAPGSANAIVSPSRLHPKAIIDSCCDNRLLSPDMAKTYGGKDPAGVVLVRKGLDGDVELSIPSKSSTKPLVLGQDVAQYAAATSASYISLVIDPRTQPLHGAADWDELERAVETLSSGRTFNAAMSGTSLEEDREVVPRSTPVVIAGLLLPLLDGNTSPRQIVQTAQFTELWQPRLASLSLNKDVCLQLLPPMVNVANAKSGNDAAWWLRATERDECVRIYLAHALECFGSHRILFGTDSVANHVTAALRVPGWQPLVDTKDWYAVTRGCLADLVKGGTAEGVNSPQHAMDDVFGVVASRVYGF